MASADARWSPVTITMRMPSRRKPSSAAGVLVLMGIGHRDDASKNSVDDYVHRRSAVVSQAFGARVEFDGADVQLIQ